MDNTDKQNTDIFKDKTIKTLAVIGFLAIIFGFGWGILKSVPKISSFANTAVVFLSSQFFSGGESEYVDTEEIITEEEDSTVLEGEIKENSFVENTIKEEPIDEQPVLNQTITPQVITQTKPKIIDLAVKIIETGYINEENEFISTSTVSLSHKAAISFEVINLGTIPSENWYFNAVLPTIPNFIFSSESQTSLNPGDKIVYNLGFDRLRGTGAQEVVINIDPTNSVKESNKSNNIVRATLEVF